MDLKKINIDKKTNRIDFFKTIGLGVAGFIAVKAMPFKMFSRKKDSKNIENTGNSRVKINPLAVSRKKIGGRNV